MKTKLQFFTKTGLIKTFLLGFLVVQSTIYSVNAQSVTLSPSGVLVPSMSTTARTALSPSNGQLVYDTTTSSFWYYSSSLWKELSNSSATADNLGNHTATQNIKLGTNYLSNDGTSKGLSIDANGFATFKGNASNNFITVGDGSNVTSILSLKSTNQEWRVGVGDGFGDKFTITDETKDETPFIIGNNNVSSTLNLNDSKVGINNSNPQETLDVSGKTKTTNFQMTNGASANYILKSDVAGNGTWVASSSLITTPIALKDTDINTKVEVEQSSNEDKIRFTLGGMEYYKMNKGTLEFLNTGNSVYIGASAGSLDTYSSNSNNVGIGSNALLNATATLNAGNVAVGYQALQDLTTSINNTAIGYYALKRVTGTGNTAVGNQAGGLVNSTGSYNTFMGSAAGAYASGSSNTLLGYLAGTYTGAGSNNVFIGREAGGGVPGSGNIMIGYQAGLNAAENVANKLYIANSSTESPLLYGDFSNSLLKINGSLGVNISPSYNLHIYKSGGNAESIVESSDNSAYVSATTVSGKEAAFAFKTISSGHKNRWLFGKSNGTESSSNIGSDFFINRYNDDGTYLGQPFSITRSTGTVNIGSLSSTTATATTLIATTANTTTLNVTGALTLATTSKTASYILSSSDYCVIFTGSTASQTLTLPASPSTGRVVMIINHSSVSLATSPSYTTASGTTSSSITNGVSVQLLYDGAVWRKIN